MGDVTPPLRRQPDVGGVMRPVCTQLLFLKPGRGPRNNQGLKSRAKTSTVIYVGTREVQSQGDALTIDDKMPLGAQLARLVPPFTGAGTVALSIVCHRHSMPLRSSYSCRHSLQGLENILALVHCCKCWWAADPEPYSRGNIFHWQPVRSTYRIALKIVRCGVGGRPPRGDRTCLGRRGSTLAQNSSETSRQPGFRGNGFRDLELRAMVGSSNRWY